MHEAGHGCPVRGCIRCSMEAYQCDGYFPSPLGNDGGEEGRCKRVLASITLLVAIEQDRCAMFGGVFLPDTKQTQKN